MRVDQPRHDRTSAAVNDPVARLRPLADLDNRARRYPDAAFPQLIRHAVEDLGVGKGRGPLGHFYRTNGESQHFLNFFPLPHGQGSLRPTLTLRAVGPGEGGGAGLAAG